MVYIFSPTNKDIALIKLLPLPKNPKEDDSTVKTSVTVDSLSISCRLPGCREERRSRSANWHSIFLSSIVVAGPVGESAHCEQQLVWGWFYRE